MNKIDKIYRIMLNEMGPQGWWPADSKVEIILGAILVQNTNWKNAEKALLTLKEQTNFESEKILNLEDVELQTLIKSSGFYRNKSKSIQSVFKWFDFFDWNYREIERNYGDELRNRLLNIHGVGEETADVFLVYVFDQVHFIADNYARKLYQQLNDIDRKETYQSLKSKVELPDHFTFEDAQEFHGLIDEFGKKFLKNRETFLNSFLADYREKGII